MGTRGPGGGAVGAGVLVPVKDFRRAKLRLAPALSPGERRALARSMAAVVIAAARPLPVWVVCDDDEVATFARDHGAQVVWRPGAGLNGAVREGVDALAALGIERVVVAHGDLPLALDLPSVAAVAADVVLVPDRREHGTNVVCLPATSPFRFAYGPDSFRRHAAEAERLGLSVEVLREPRLGWDVDVPDDLALPEWTSPASLA